MPSHIFVKALDSIVPISSLCIYFATALFQLGTPDTKINDDIVDSIVPISSLRIWWYIPSSRKLFKTWTSAPCPDTLVARLSIQAIRLVTEAAGFAPCWRIG